VLFSPIGEEIFFRGVLQRALEQRFSVNTSTSIECAAFGLVTFAIMAFLQAHPALSYVPFRGPCGRR
jgi:uncharacterized protein